MFNLYILFIALILKHIKSYSMYFIGEDHAKLINTISQSDASEMTDFKPTQTHLLKLQDISTCDLWQDLGILIIYVFVR